MDNTNINKNRKETESLSEMDIDEVEAMSEQLIQMSHDPSEIDDDDVENTATTSSPKLETANKSELTIYIRSPLFEKENDMPYIFNNYIDVEFEYCNTNGLILRDFHSSSGIIEPIEDTRTNQPNSDTLSSLQQLPLKELSEEQQDFVKFIHTEVESMSVLSEFTTKFIFLTGFGGTGKTSTLPYLRNIKNSKILYVVNTKSLCAMIRAKFQLNTINVCQFFMKSLNLRASEALKLMNSMQEELYSGIAPTINREFFREMFPENEFVIIIFFDEFSMFSPHALKRFIDILTIASKELCYKILIIFCGDFMHIPSVITASMDYGTIIDKSYKTFNFEKQLRITDVNYLNTLMQLTRDPPVCTLAFLNALKQITCHNINSSTIEYSYPLDLIEKAYQKFKRFSNIYSFLDELGEDFFSNVLTLKAFAFLNTEVFDLNLNFAYNIIQQLIQLNKDFEFIRSLVCIAQFESHCLPLIRFFPYYVLSIGSDYSGSIVYMIDWKLHEGYVIVYYPYDKKFLKVPFDSFYMKAFPRRRLFGIPLELAFASTFHKAQGQTFEEYIVVSLNRVDYRDLFSILLRVHTVKQIKNLFRKEWLDN